MPAKSIRLPVALWRKIQWRSTETNQPQSEVIRNLIGDALADQMPPAAQESPVPIGSDGQRERWEKLAAHREQTLEEFTRWLLNQAAAKWGDKIA